MSIGEQMTALLARTGLPSAFNYFPAESPVYKPPKPPFITYIIEETSNFFADGKVYAKMCSVGIELYTDRYDPKTEALLEAALDEACIPWDSEREWIKTEKMYQTTYKISLVEREEK